MTAERKILLLLGATAVGKTAAACALYDALGGADAVALISVDATMVYRGFDIGAAKPTPAELARHPHALIDVADPAQPYTVATFVEAADAVVAAALDAGRLPVLVGGSMLYARRFLEGLATLPSASDELRETLADEWRERGGEALHAELAQADPQAAARIHPNNPQRLLRALEVLRGTGRPISELWAERAGQGAPARHDAAVHTVALAADDRAELHARIEARFQAMLAAGFLDEVRGLQARGDLHPALPAVRAVGYRQAWQHLNGELTHDRFVADALTATRRLAKRQLTWLRQWPDARALSWRLSPAQIAEEIVKQLT